MRLTPCSDDIQNQKAALLANEVDPDCKRTIGVLTKVDTLQGREVDLWLKVLKNETEPLLYGYYVSASKARMIALADATSPRSLVSRTPMSLRRRSVSTLPERESWTSSPRPHHGIPSLLNGRLDLVPAILPHRCQSSCSRLSERSESELNDVCPSNLS
jgi:hypothetical protein